MLKLLPRFLPRLFKKEKTLCTITFIYNTKGVYGAGKGKSETIFAWIERDSTTHECAKLFKPAGIDVSRCVITDVIVLPIQTVYHEEN